MAPCLWVLAAATLSVTEADELTLGQKLTVQVPCAVLELLNSQGHRWLSNSHITQYQGLLVGNPQITFQPVKALNPATCLPTDLRQPDHDCHMLTDKLFASWPDLKVEILTDIRYILWMEAALLKMDKNSWLCYCSH